MRSVLSRICAIVWTALLSQLQSGCTKPTDEIEPVAEYGNPREKDGARASALLAAHHIQSLTVGSAGLEICVYPATRADEARRILVHAIKDEGLQVELIKFDPKSNRFSTLSPESVLGNTAKL